MADHPDLYTQPDSAPRQMIFNRPPMTDPAEIASSQALAAEIGAHHDAGLPGPFLSPKSEDAPCCPRCRAARLIEEGWACDIMDDGTSFHCGVCGFEICDRDPEWLKRAVAALDGARIDG